MNEQEGNVKVDINVVFKEVEVAKIKLQPGDVLSVTIKGDDLTASDLHDLKDGFRKTFPDNKILMFMIRDDMDVKFEIFTGEENESDKK